ncbi:hypothetical protein ESA94_20420 [Lacibacter luteus]|uniref:Coil containing protein n=1 Tax=Lacibacter luteus TaxID=2508719 RepID=A0A4Q1CDC6_9BACT|nr:hypothetical protein [Lacibacter luteus]RXK57566.1 hypothetical protein ESA94_20420 [Lacibacter luteus]
MLEQKLSEFFETHPKANEVHEALGRLFTHKEVAQKFLAGVNGKAVTTYTRNGVKHETKSEEIYHAMLNQQNVINEKQLAYENAPGVEKQQAMSEWKAAQDTLKQLEHDFNKQRIEEKKDAAKQGHKKEVAPPKTEKPGNTDPEALAKKIAAKEKEIASAEAKREKAKGAEKTKLTNRLKTLNAELEALKVQLPAEPAKEEATAPVMIDHVVTEEDLISNPDLGAAVGEVIQIPAPIDHNPQ